MSGIRIVTEPALYLVGRQEVVPGEVARFLDDHGASGWDTDAPSAGEGLVEIAGRLCYLSFRSPRPGGNAAYIGHIKEVKHGSVLEHAVFNLIVTGISRSCSHELVRHRVGLSPSQLSQRYVDESDVAFVVPPALLPEVTAARDFIGHDGPDGGNHAWFVLDVVSEWDDEARPGDGVVAGLRWLAGREADLEEYGRHVEYLASRIAAGDRTARRKAAREAARSALPNCTETKIFLTMNARAARHFIELRASAHADAEIRRLAVAIQAVLAGVAPNLFGDYRPVTLPDGSTALETDHAGV
jgi:thymidylate synthase (FAD)